MTEKEAKELYLCAKSVQEEGIWVEIGTWKGASIRIINAAKSKKKGKVFTIDNFRTDIFPSGRGVKEETIEYLKKEKVTLLIGESEDAAKTWSEGVIDFLFIDGDHRYEGVAADIKNWLPYVRKGGKVLFHDYDSHEDVTKAIHRAIEDKLIEPIKKVGSLLVTIKSQ